MVELPGDWRSAVPTQCLENGCVVWAYEWMLHYAGISGIEFDDFQEEFDKGPESDLQSIAEAIQARYNHVLIRTIRFMNMVETFNEARGHVERNVPSVICIGMTRNVSDEIKRMYHIMPVIAVGQEHIRMVHMRQEYGIILCDSSLADIERNAESFTVSGEIAYLAKPRRAANGAEAPLGSAS